MAPKKDYGLLNGLESQSQLSVHNLHHVGKVREGGTVGSDMTLCQNGHVFI